MYKDEYKRWLEADLEDADLNPELSGSREMTKKSRNGLRLR